MIQEILYITSIITIALVTLWVVAVVWSIKKYDRTQH